MTTSTQHIDAMKQALAHLREDPSRYDFKRPRKPVPGKSDCGCLLGWTGYFAGIPDKTPYCDTVATALLNISENEFYEELYHILEQMGEGSLRLIAGSAKDRRLVFDAFERFIEEEEAGLCG